MTTAIAKFAGMSRNKYSLDISDLRQELRCGTIIAIDKVFGIDRVWGKKKSVLMNFVITADAQIGAKKISIYPALRPKQSIYPTVWQVPKKGAEISLWEAPK